MQEMLATSQEVARSTVEAAQAADLAESETSKMNVSVEAIRGLSGHVDGLAEVMQQLLADSAEIGRVLEVISSIAGQTNLLALNAAIEAARAGEHGRGFAVVADEISKLASATSDNSREISSEIIKMIGDIKQGMAIVEETRKSIETIFGRIEDINERINNTRDVMSKQAEATREVTSQAELMDGLSRNIATATREQNTSMEENIKTVSRLSEIAQEVALANQKILDFTSSIMEKSGKLREIISSRA